MIQTNQPRRSDPTSRLKSIGILLLAMWCAISVSAWAQDSDQKSLSPNGKPIAKTHSQMKQTVKRFLLIQKELKELEAKTPTRELVEQIGKLHAEEDQLGERFEVLAIQIPKENLLSDQEKEKEWIEELQEITRPILNSIGEFTERPRKIDHLKARIETQKLRIEQYRSAGKSIRDLQKLSAEEEEPAEPEEPSQVSAKEIKRKFDHDLTRLKGRYNPEVLVAELEDMERTLANLQATEKRLLPMISESIADFMRVRGRNLFFALGLFLGLWWVLTLAYKLVESKTRLLRLVPRSINKFLKAAYHLIIFFIAIITSLASLYLVDDWLLLSLLLMALIAIGWMSRQFVPRFLNELKMMLNLGTVREGERLFYRGLPWLVKEIGIQAILHNPRLDGGIIRVPVGKLLGYSSRQFVKEEEWFPTEVGDWVLLDDIYALVLSQTPEQVILRHRGSRRFYITREFLISKPRNLSSGFLLLINFGLDYAKQKQVCDEIPELFQQELEVEFKDWLEAQPPVFESLKVKFNQAGASSLDLLVLTSVNGQFADHYFSYQRDINKALVAICNRHGFEIPFTQMTLNFPSSMETIPGLKPDQDSKE